MVILKHVSQMSKDNKYFITWDGTKFPLFKVNDNLGVSFDDSIQNMTNAHVKVVINGITMGTVNIVPYGDKICLMAIPGLNYHPMSVDYRLTANDIMKFKSFELIIQRKGRVK